jgi:hypothetical protein
MEGQEEVRRKRLRSPSFPFISLREAMERARKLYEGERRNPASLEVAAGHWGYSTKSSGASQTIAALRAYGLLEAEGTIRLTERAVHILLEPDGSPKRGSLLREAALAPHVHALLWERYSADLPPDKPLGSFLTRELGFNPGAVDDFIRGYKETLAFAGLREEVRPALSPPPSPLPASGDLGLSFPLLNGNRVDLRVLRKIDPVEAEQLRKLFEIWLETIVERG